MCKNIYRFIFLLLATTIISNYSNAQNGGGGNCFAITNQQNVTCNGLCNGTATVIYVSGGGTVTSYSWNTNPVQTTQTATNLCAGNYTVTVHTSTGCVTTANVTITQPQPLVATTTHVNVSCHGGTNGSATVNVTGGGGFASYSYAWNTTPVQTTQTANNLAAGTYTVVVTQTNNNNGCTTSSTVTITEPPAINASTTTSPSQCGQANGTATVTASGGTGNLTYSWNTNPVQTTQTAHNLAPGTYTVTVRDANNCTTTATATVTNTGGATLALSSTGSLCPGGANGTATVIATGGAQPYSYSWNTNPVQTTQTATGLTAGTYQVTVTDNTGCTSTGSVQVVNPSQVSVTATASDVLCAGQSNGVANAVGSGGTPPYLYSWNSNPVQNTQTATGLPAGDYIVTVYDDNGCSNTATVTVGAPDGLDVSITSTPITCNGAANGTATAHVSGGTPGFAYSWNTSPEQTTQTAVGLFPGTYSLTVTDTNGCSVFSTVGISQPPAINATTSATASACGQPTGTATVTASGGTGNLTYSWNTNPVQTTSTATGLSAGTYTVTVTDATGCTRTATATVPNSGGLTSSATHTNVSCNGGANGTATASASGGTPGYSWSWNSQPVQTTQTAFNLPAGTYTVTITDQAGCVSTSTTTITQPAAITITAEVQGIGCFGEQTGSVDASVSGGVGPYSYSWNTTPEQTTAAISGLESGDYTLTVTDGQGCTADATFSVSQPSSVLEATTVHSNILCNGESTGAATVTATGGTGPYTYSWNSNPEQNSSTAFNLPAGTYTVSVTDDNGCTTTASATILEPSALAIEVSSTETSCSVANGTTTVSASGGTPGYSYLWNTNPAQTTETATGLSSGDYSVIVTDANGCTQTANISVTNQGGLSAEITGTNVSCNGGNNGSATVAVSGGTPAYSYAWNTNPVQTTATIYDLPASTYTATVTDAAGCVYAATVIISEPEPIVVTTEVQNIQCHGEQNGSATASATGGVLPYTGYWDTDPVQYAQTISGLAAGDYTITVIDANGCEATATATVTEPATALTATVIHTNVSCNGGSNGAATANTFGGVPPYSYLWNDANNQTTQTAIALPAGSYSVMIMDANGCMITKIVTITQPAPIAVEISSVSPACNQSNGSATATASGGTGTLDYSWNTNPVQNTATASDLAAGYYTVTVSDDNGCSVTGSVALNNTGGPTLQVASSDVSCYGSTNGVAVASASGGGGPYSFSWNTNPAQTTQSITNLSPGSYTVTVTNSNGCTSVGSVTISQPDALTAATSSTDPSCGICADGSATVTPSGGTAPYSYVWDNGQTTATAQDLTEGTYCVTVTDDNGCETNTCVTLTALVTGIVNASLSDNSFTVYPNPTSGTITVELETTQLSRITLTLTNMLGQNIVSQQSEVNGLFKQVYDLSAFAEGLYFITVRSENEMLFRKVLKK